MDIRPEERYAPRDQAERLQTLNEISRVLASTLDLHALYDAIYHQISRIMDATLFSLAIHDPGSDVVRLPYIREKGNLFTDQTVPYGNNVTSLVIDRGTPLLFHADAEYEAYVAANGLPRLSVGEEQDEGMIFVPLSTGSTTIGCLSVGSMRRNAYTQEDVETLTIIAAQAAVAIENAGLYQRSQEAVREMQALLRVARAVNSSLDLGEVFEAILTSAREVVPFTYAAIILPDYTDGALAVVGSLGPEGTRVARAHDGALRFPMDQGVSGAVLRSGKPLIVPDTRAFSQWVPSTLPNVFSEIAVPLIQDGAPIGALNAGREGVNAFSTHDLDVLTLFAAQAAIAIENARLYTDQRHRVDELQTIQSIIHAIMPLHDITAITDTVNAQLKTLIDFHSCRLFVLEEGTLLPITRGHHETRMPITSGITGWIARHGESVLIDNVLEDERSKHIPGTPVRPESLIGAPLIVDDTVQGVITLTKLGVRQFDSHALRVLEIIAAQIAIAFERARLYDRLRSEAITDALTGLFNRRYLQERYLQERSRAIRNRHPLSAIMLDIDRFKPINDRWGHDAGDVVLRELAALMRQEVRAEDIVARYGGEEFCILLPHSPLSDAERVAWRICRAVEAHNWPADAGTDRVTVSLGVAGLFSAGEEHDAAASEAVISAADLAMYAAKRAGGNMVHVASLAPFDPARG